MGNSNEHFKHANHHDLGGRDEYLEREVCKDADELDHGEFGARVDFGQHHPECPPDYNQVRLRVGNWRLTLHFNFVNCEFKDSFTDKVSEVRVTKGFARYSGLSVENIRNSASLLSKLGVTAEQVIENIKRLTGK